MLQDCNHGMQWLTVTVMQGSGSQSFKTSHSQTWRRVLGYDLGFYLKNMKNTISWCHSHMIGIMGHSNTSNTTTHNSLPYRWCRIPKVPSHHNPCHRRGTQISGDSTFPRIWNNETWDSRDGCTLQTQTLNPKPHTLTEALMMLVTPLTEALKMPMKG